MALGFLAAWRMLVWLCKRTGQNSDQVAMLLTFVMIAAVVGARAVYVAQHWAGEFAQNPLAIIRLDQGGLVYYGGLIGALIVYVGYALCTRRNFFEMADLSAAVLPLGQAFGRFGCFMHGCCWGKPCDSWLGVPFPKGSPVWWEHLNNGLIRETASESLPVIPTQLIESAATLALFVVLFRLYPRHYQRRGLIGGLYLTGYAVLRFVIEYLRNDPRGTVGPFSTSQAISLVIFAGGLACIAFSFRRAGRKAVRAE
jgi:phosphatidylglycerol:prolipoprotein diacylglycerol transferase